MRLIRSFLSAVACCSILSSQATHAAAFQFYELGTPIVGTAAVGQAANINHDASTAYFNPAGMAGLPQSNLMIGGQLMLPYIYFAKRFGTTISGDNGGSAGTLTPAFDIYYVYSYSPRLKLGVSLVSPYGGQLTYNDGWVGRYIVQTLLFYTVNLNPALAYQVNQWLAVGGGISIEYAYLRETVALPIVRDIDGQLTIKGDNVSPGVNVGIMLTPTQTTKLGVAYRSRITHDFRGKVTFLRIATQPSASTVMVMPQNVIISLSQGLTNELTLLGELGWSNWSSMKNSVLNVGRFTSTTRLNWNDTYRVGLGGQYQFTPSFLFQAGASFDSSPTNSSHRLPDLPMDRQIRIGAGMTYALIKAVNVGLSYEYLNFGTANINNVSSNGVLTGSYARNYANVVQASLNVEC